MKRGRQHKGKVNVAKRQKQFAAAKPAMAAGGYQAGREFTGQPKQELKGFDNALQTLTPNTVAGAPVHINLNAMVNGAEMFNRVGRKTYAKSIRIRGKIYPTGAATEGCGRIIIYFDAQPNAALPTIQALIQDSNAAAATSWASGINLTNRQRFQILRDYQTLLGDATNVAGAAEIIPDPIKNSNNVDFFIPLKGLESIYNGTNGGTIADITSGAINIVWVNDGTLSGWAFDFTSRLRYYD